MAAARAPLQPARAHLSQSPVGPFVRAGALGGARSRAGTSSGSRARRAAATDDTRSPFVLVAADRRQADGDTGPGGTPATASRTATRPSARLSLAIAAPLSDADAAIQPMPDASPAKWHLAHTTWFFETFVLRDHLPGYRLYDESFAYLFNSYYEGEGERQPRGRRGMIAPALARRGPRLARGRRRGPARRDRRAARAS